MLTQLARKAARRAEKRVPAVKNLRRLYRSLRGGGPPGPDTGFHAGRAKLIERLKEPDPKTKQKLEAFKRVYQEQTGLDHVQVVARNHGHRYYAMSHLLGGLEPGPGQRCLEVGCGPGLMSMVFKMEHRNLDFAAVDRYERPIQIGRITSDFLGSPVDLRSVEGAKLTDVFDKNLFDIVFLCEVLEHLEYGEPQRELLEATMEVTKPGAQVVVTVPFEDRIPSPGHLTEFSREMLTALLEPYAVELRWHEDLRTLYKMEKHFIVSFRTPGD